jgi:hypothetical protein
MKVSTKVVKARGVSMAPGLLLRVLLVRVLLLAALGCGAAGETPTPGRTRAPADNQQPPLISDPSLSGAAGSSAAGSSAVGGEFGPDFGAGLSDEDMAGAPPGGDCGSTQAGATLVREPIDIILVVDNSDSMANEIIGVQNNINVNFASILAAADLDYRVILIGRHGQALEDNSICIEAPLSGAASCDPLPATAVFTDRFFQYNMKIDSHDTFVKLIGAYRAPFEDTIFEDKSYITEDGWNVYLRPGVRKVFVELTDDDPTEMTWQAFDAALLALDAAQFGSAAARNYIWHSIVGIDEKPVPSEAWLPGDGIVPALCGAPDDVESAGVPYQELSRLTGGLRFPLCQSAAYDVVFRRIATDVITRTDVACDFAIPAPPEGKTLDLDKVAVSYTESVGLPAQTYAQARDRSGCQANAFFIENERIFLCPDSCELLKANPLAAIDVLFTCESTIIEVR